MSTPSPPLSRFHVKEVKMAIFQLDFLALWLLTSRLATALLPPTQTTDGYCFSYIIQGYDTCASIASAHAITQADIEAFNKDTWAWLGCGHLYQGDFICLSPGKPPMPMALPHATCGPQVPGTTRPENWNDLAGLNPCLMDACCSWWGQCGVSELYCERAVREPPAGATATVKPVTADPGSASAKTGSPAKTGAGTATKIVTTTKAKTTAQAKTTTKAAAKATTKVTTKAKATTTKKPDPVQDKPVTPDPWDAPWEMTLYAEKGCKGDYYHLEGYNEKLYDDKDHCLVLRGGLNSVFSETEVTCNFWTDDGFTKLPCEKGTLKSPQSWIVKEGFCTGFEGTDCYCLDHYQSEYEAKGCQNRLAGYDPPTFGSLMCAKKMEAAT
ncbi:uncharacterized protein N7515_003173 [Penicillium bovifimosum]|uniref:LysM domain-containing protein n=1 Tax=Penicillium bovifimosum TaxID=126998 RepID=A0A9W9H465_9EURO|nr:uncharacterized protein N7515_003173 [Penicillium bovifimosum]KAJ5138325.1 hypothetical protein N7515_003173 [Penicillium bovifimosum]